MLVGLRMVLDRDGRHGLTTGTAVFGIMRFITGLGVGALVATTGALVSEFAPPGKKNLVNAITYSGVPIGSLLAALLAILLLGPIGWRGMFWIGALPLVTLLPLAHFQDARVAWPGWRPAGVSKRRARSSSGPACRCPKTATSLAPAKARSAWAGAGPASRACSARATVPHGGAGTDERDRPGARLLAEHLASRAHGTGRLQRQRVAVVPAGAERRCILGAVAGFRASRTASGPSRSSPAAS